MYYVYILQSLKDKRLYVGYSNDLKKRIEEHNKGKVKSTSTRRPLKLICYEAYLTKKEAMHREKYLKGSDGRKNMKIRLFNSLID